jgi:all-trans-retinol 13,14-reductase
MIYDCVVIGAGLSGLASSIILSKNGLKTALVERSGKTGPLVRGFRRKHYYFDTGFHHAGGIAEGSSGNLMLNYLGVLSHLSMFPCNPDCFDIIRFKDSSFEFHFPTGYEHIRDRLSEAFPDELHTIDRYLDEVKRQCSLLPFLNLGADPNQMNILENVHAESLSKFISGLTDNRTLKSVLGVHVLLNGVPSGEQSLNNYAYIVGPYYESVNCIEGGGSALIDAFDRSAKDNGVDLFTGKEADKLLFSSSGDLAGVVFKDGATLKCRKSISTIHPLHFLNLVPEQMFRSSYVRRIKSLDETPSAYILYCSSETGLNNMAGSSVYLLPADGSDFGDCGRPLEERPANLIVNKSRRTAGNNGNEFIVILPALINEVEEWGNSTRGNRPPEYLAFKEEIKERILNHVLSFYPGLKGKIQAVGCSTPLTLRDYSGSPFGSMYGVKHKIEQYNPFPITKIPGLYLAGQSIVAPGLLGTMISAFLACGNILGHEFIRGELNRWG